MNVLPVNPSAQDAISAGTGARIFRSILASTTKTTATMTFTPATDPRT